MIPGENGLFDVKTVKESSLPVFDFTLSETTGIPIIFWTYTELKKHGWKLNYKQRETMIKGFIKTSNRMQGYAALYDFCEVMEMFCGYKPNYIADK